MTILARFGRAALSPCTRRTFSSTAARPATIPEFVRSSSDELDTKLQIARDRIIIPKHLTPRETRIVYGTKHRKLFENEDEPVIAHIGGTDVRLQPLDPKKDHPPLWGTLKSVITLAQTPSDWANVERLLVGFQKAGIKLSPSQVVSVVRKAWFQGHQDAVLRMVERAHETGICIQTEELLSTLLWGLREVAVAGHWSRRALERALTGVRQVADYLEAPEHAGGERAVKPGDLRTLPLTIAAPLELLGVYHVRYAPKIPNVRDKALDELRQGAERLLNNIKIYGCAVQKPSSTAAIKLRYERLKDAEKLLMRVIPVRHAVALAQRLLVPSDKMPQPQLAAQTLEECDALIRQNVKLVEENLSPGQTLEENWAVRGWRACGWVDEGIKKKTPTE
ncbi:hypothetical protein IWX90DRAFT_511765 [Phyllosticta citrichinensis]|uniref:Uncharacterized protein n=1 Tax=Phyllosticta citrichinensis TaxID=1130410 RepID=A0ABR1XY36_9PEZI